MERFSREKRIGEVSFDEFMDALGVLKRVFFQRYLDGSVEVITCEDRNTYNFSTVTFVSDEVSEALEQRKRYTLKDLTPEVWRRSYSIMVRFSETESGEIYPFYIWVECDTFRDRSRIVFGFDAKTDKDKNFIELLKEELGKGKFLFRFLWKFGDGELKSSNFNFAYGAKLTGLFSRGSKGRRRHSSL